MSKTGRINHRRGMRGRPKAERHISVRSVRRDPPDLSKLSRAIIAIVLRDAAPGTETAAPALPSPATENPPGETTPPQEDVHD